MRLAKYHNNSVNFQLKRKKIRPVLSFLHKFISVRKKNSPNAKIPLSYFWFSSYIIYKLPHFVLRKNYSNDGNIFFKCPNFYSTGEKRDFNWEWPFLQSRFICLIFLIRFVFQAKKKYKIVDQVSENDCYWLLQSKVSQSERNTSYLTKMESLSSIQLYRSSSSILLSPIYRNGNLGQ